MAKSTAKTRVKTTTVIREEGEGTGETGGDELEIPAGNGSDPAVDVEEMDAIAKLRELSGGNSMARFEVRRVMPSSEAGYAGTLADEELTMERLADEFGPGTYTIRVRLPGGKFAGSDRVQIAGVPKHRQPPAQSAAQAAAPVASGGGLPEMMAMMQRGTDAQINMLSSLVKSLIERPLPTPPTPPPPPDTLAILATAKQLFAQKSDGGGLELFMKGLEFGKELGGSGETDMGDLIVKGIDGLKELAATQPQPVQRRQRPALPAPGTVPAAERPAAAPPAQTTQEGQSMNTLQMIQWLTKQTQHLLVCAHRQKDPELYAEVFLDNLPPSLDETVILERLKAPDAVEQLAKLDRRVLAYRPWFEAFRAACVELIEAGPDEETDTEGLEEGAADAPDDIPGEFEEPAGGGEG